MDDPWGSPWAEESPYLSQKVDKLVSKNPVGSEKDLGASQDTKSPWNDDDEYGEWATLPTTDEIQVNLQDGPEQAESAESDASVSDELTQGKGHIRPDGSNWFTREISPANVGNLIVDRSQINNRALSPDPWAREATISDEKPKPDFGADANSGSQTSAGDIDKDITSVELPAVSDVDKPNRTDHGELDGPLPAVGIGDIPLVKPEVQQDRDVIAVGLELGSVGAAIGEATRGECSASRPSSSPSDHSHHDEVFTESPRTSFEDAEERPKLRREGSSKVKEMVRLFDGLAVDQSISDLSCQGPGETRGDQLDASLVAQSEDDFGDFEEGTLSIATKVVQAEGLSAIAEAEQVAKAGAPDSPAVDVSPEQEITSPSDQSAKTYGPVHFEPKLSLLGQIFGSTANTNSVHADSMLMPEIEAVITDSLSSIQERKTWYRISRYGTLRKHNTGDEDSYVRINWKDSEIRVETLKTVERWIEEDRLGGGVILGGGTRLGSMFGWGQKNAAPMSVAAALASRSGKAAVRPDHVESPMSITSPDATPSASPLATSASSRRSPEQISASRRSFQSPLSATAPQFTWSTGTSRSSTGGTKPTSLPAPINPHNSDQIFGTTTTSPKLSNDSSFKIPVVMTTTPPAQKSRQVQSPNIVAQDFTSPGREPSNINVPESSVKSVSSQVEDEWGEMVTSPSLESPLSLVKPVTAQINAVTSGMPSPALAANSSAISLGTKPDRRSAVDVLASQQSAGNPVISNVESPAIQLDSVPPAVPKSDPWQAADFSFFDDPVRSTRMPAPVPVGPGALGRSSVTVRQGSGLSSEQMERDKVVKSIVQNLPNLSYMLRR